MQQEQAASQRRLTVLAQQVAPQACSASLVSPQPCSSSTQPAAAQSLLHGKVAIITGAGKGIGEAAARLLASQGASVVVCDLDGAAAQKVANDIQAAGGRSVAVTADVTHADTPQRIVHAAVTTFGGIDILVNNAGFTWDGVIQKMTPEQWEMMLLVHCTAPFKLIQAAEPYMRGAGKKEAEAGHEPSARYIINISSTSGTHGNAGQTNYATAKAGVVGLTKSVAKEWGPFGVRCNAIAFGLIDTRLTRAKDGSETIQVGGQKVVLGMPNADAYWSAVKSQLPLRRTGTAEEAAGAVLMLCTPWSNYMTGQCLEVNGGAFM